jgi:hypothetical protein
LADVFLSYASEDRDTARLIAQLLEGQSWTVWWDRKIPAGVAYDEVIESEIGAAKYVVVLWSIHSTKSEWVKNEAASAVEHEKLIPVQIDDSKLPLEFRRRQTLSLSGWSGDAYKYSVKQTDPDKGLTMLGTAVRSGNGYKLMFEVLPAPVVKGKALLAIADSGNTLNVAYEYEDGKRGKLLFRR